MPNLIQRNQSPVSGFSPTIRALQMTAYNAKVYQIPTKRNAQMMPQQTGSASKQEIPKNAPQPQPNAFKQPTASIIKASHASAPKMGKRVKTATAIMISVNLLLLSAATQTVHNASHAPERTPKVRVVARRISRKPENAPRAPMFAISWEHPVLVTLEHIHGNI